MTRSLGIGHHFPHPWKVSHGQSWPTTPTYRSWQRMKQRCFTGPAYPGWMNYGGRGITVCDRWDAFENFLADMGERPEGMTLDRIDTDADYEPSNVRWATASEQGFNRRQGLPRKTRSDKGVRRLQGAQP